VARVLVALAKIAKAPAKAKIDRAKPAKTKTPKGAKPAFDDGFNPLAPRIVISLPKRAPVTTGYEAV
jgi:hypothetical protein